MESEETYYATRKVFASYAAFFHEVATAIGIEKALALHERAHERMGVSLARTLAGPCHPQCTLETIRGILLESNRSLGIDSELEEVTPSRAVLRNGRCPMFDGYWMGGLDEGTARSLCERGASVKLGTAFRELNPHFGHRISSYRADSEGSCLEEIALQ